MRDPRPAFPDVNDSQGNGLRVNFAWQQDRYAHKIVAVSEGQETWLLESIEGTSDEAWPPSPPLQQLSIEEIRPGVVVALLVGMAGKSHWSVSIEPEPERTGFVFDVACRSRQNPARLASSYRWLAPDSRQTDSEVKVKLGRGEVSLSALPIGESFPMMRQSGETLSLEPRQVADRGARTNRWKYRVEMVNARRDA